MPLRIDDWPTVEEWERIEERVAQGQAPFDACRAVRENLTSAMLHRADQERHEKLLDDWRSMMREEHARVASKGILELAQDREHKDHAKGLEMSAKFGGILRDGSGGNGDGGNVVIQLVSLQEMGRASLEGRDPADAGVIEARVTHAIEAA